MTKSLMAHDLLPRWTARAVTTLSGRDPMGLSRVAHKLTDGLMTGIITTTDRARYYSFYTWCLWHIEKHEKPDKFDDFQAAFQRRQMAMTLASLLVKRDMPLIGKRVVSKIVERLDEKDTVDTERSVLSKNPLGGYGQNYRGCLNSLGLFKTAEGGIDTISGPRAEEIAREFHSQIIQSPYIKEELFSQNRIPIKSLKRSAEALSMTSLESAAAKNERQLLIDLFWGNGQPANTADQRTALRRASMTLLFWVLERYRAAGIAVDPENLTRQVIYGPCYHGVLIDVSADKWAVKNLDMNPLLREVALWWRQFALHNYLAYALESLLSAILDLAATIPGGRTIEDIISELIGDGFHETLNALTGHRCDEPSQLVASYVGARKSIMDTDYDRVGARPFLDPGSEELIWEFNTLQPSPAVKAAQSCATFAALYARWSTSTDPAYEECRRMADEDLWIGAIIPQIDDWGKSSSWPVSLRHLIVNTICVHHDHIMYEKKSPEACWIMRNGSLYVAEQPLDPAWRASRLWQAVSIMSDLGLLSLKDQALSVTSEGRRQLQHALSTIS